MATTVTHLVLMACLGCGGARPPIEDADAKNTADVWFGDLRTAPRLETTDLVSVPAIVKKALETDVDRLEGLPAALEADVAPRAVFLTASDSLTPAKVVCGTGRGLRAALLLAMSSLRERSGAAVPTRWIKVDFVTTASAWAGAAATGGRPFERSLEGLAFGRASGAAFLPEELVARTLVSSSGEVMERNIARYRLRRSGLKSEADLGPSLPRERWRFKTRAFFLAQGRTVPLYRGNPPRERITREVLLRSVRAGSDYLRRAVRENGSFVYGYDPKTGTESSKYNMVRHAGTIYSMLDVYETTRDPRLLEAAERAIAYLLDSIKPYGGDGDGARIMTYGGKIKLGGVALAAVALAEHVTVTGKKDHLPVARGLCRYICKNQMEDGKFVHSRYYPSGAVGSHISSYYPGEALLALVRLHAIDGDGRWLDVAEKGARYLIEVRDRGKDTRSLTHDHWLLYALNELYRHRKRSLYLDHALRIATAIELAQRKEPSSRDWMGSYYKPPRSTPTACRCEGMAATYRLARRQGARQVAEKILDNLRRGAGFQLLSQIGPAKALYTLDPRRALGGFTRSLTNHEVRIDYVQHNISALVSMYRILVDEKRDEL